METYTELKEMTDNPYYQKQRQNSLRHLTDDMIDAPILGIVKGFNKLPYCFTLQSCYGHFVYEGKDDPNNLEPLPVDGNIGEIEYRIAYIALCIENSPLGKEFFMTLKEMTSISPGYIQFICADWFWKKQVNSYALQVEPDRFKHQDTAIVDLKEALHIENIRNEFFIQLNKILKKAAMHRFS